MIIPIIIVSCRSLEPDEIYIHTNQAGFLPQDTKTALVLSKNNLSKKTFYILDTSSNNVLLQNTIDSSDYSYGDFDYCYEIDFSAVKKSGNYKIKISNTESYSFEVNETVFNPIRDSLSLFFKVQRCGPTNPIMHQPCHLSDAAKLIGYQSSSGKDLTGGWHDAGDYIKFLKTTAYTTYLLLFSFEFDDEKFGFDLDKNGIPDILEEARVGLDWLIRANIDGQALAIQVQDETDHSVGWRLPEKDTLQFNRPAFVSISKNSIGYYASVLALAYRIWKDKFYDHEFSSQCLDLAKKFYSLKDNVAEFDSLSSDHYPDKDFNGKLALAAIELFNSTGEKNYLEDAVRFGRLADADFWWSVGQINSLAHYKIAKYFPEFSNYIYKNLQKAKENSDKNPFRLGLDFSWGTNNTLLGISLQSILYKKLTGSQTFDSLSIYQRDFILGRNAWGISFIHNIGKKYPKNLHSQIAYFNNGYLPGGLSAGPAPKTLFNNRDLSIKNFEYNLFNSEEVKYHDDYADYITNEPTLAGNATALFVIGYYCIPDK